MPPAWLLAEAGQVWARRGDVAAGLAAWLGERGERAVWETRRRLQAEGQQDSGQRQHPADCCGNPIGHPPVATPGIAAGAHLGGENSQVFFNLDSFSEMHLKQETLLGFAFGAVKLLWEDPPCTARAAGASGGAPGMERAPLRRAPGEHSTLPVAAGHCVCRPRLYPQRPFRSEPRPEHVTPWAWPSSLS